VSEDLLAEARRVLDYNPETGVLTWKVDRNSYIKAGSRAGAKNSEGYIHLRVGGKSCKAHRIAWLLAHGSLPDCDIDHINGDRADNRLCNLRAATRAENGQNQKRAHSSNKTSGLLGVHWHAQSKKWRSVIAVNKEKKYLGLFDTAEEAHAAYLKAKAELHPFQTIAGGKP